MSLFAATGRPKAKTIPALLDEVAARRPNHPAVMYRGETLTYAQLRSAARTVAKSLRALGVKRGDRVGVMLANQPEWLMMSLGSACLGATFVPLNTWYKRTEIEWTMGHCGLSVLVSLSRFLKQDFASVIRDIVPELAASEPGQLKSAKFPSLRAVAMLGDRLPGTFSWSEFLNVGASQSDDDVDKDQAAVEPGDAAYILYTSGSTADPKGVLLGHGGVVGNGYDMGQRRFVDGSDRIWIGTPLFYGLGATNALPVALTHGATVVLQDSFTAGSAIETISQTGATVYYGTGNMTRAILDHPDFSLKKIGTLKKGNAGTMTEFKRMTLVEMGISLASPAYGLTESYGNATVGAADDPLEAKLHTNGRPLPGFELAIVDPVTRRPLPQGETGLVLLRGHTTLGYFNNPTETAKALYPDGFFDTGDLGSLDADGRFIFHSRLKEVIKSGGINVSPIEVEQLLVRHPHIRDAHVVGVPDSVRGEVVVAFVDVDAKISEQEVRDFMRERSASFKVPQHVFFYTEEQLPRLASGKVAKYRLVADALRLIG
jgi:fatty-acyl-CoA synthase